MSIKITSEHKRSMYLLAINGINAATDEMGILSPLSTIAQHGHRSRLNAAVGSGVCRRRWREDTLQATWEVLRRGSLKPRRYSPPQWSRRGLRHRNHWRQGGCWGRRRGCRPWGLENGRLEKPHYGFFQTSYRLRLEILQSVSERFKKDRE